MKFTERFISFHQQVHTEIDNLEHTQRNIIKANNLNCLQDEIGYLIQVFAYLVIEPSRTLKSFDQSTGHRGPE